MVTTRRSSTPSGPAATEADTAGSPKKEVASTKKKSARPQSARPQSAEDDSMPTTSTAATEADPSTSKTPLTSGPSSSAKQSVSRLRFITARERDIILSREWRKPKGFLESSLALFKCTLFRVDFVLGTYFFDWWESIMVCTFYFCILGLVTYSVYKQASTTGAMLKSAIQSALAAVSHASG
jgi:hypothetical protein